MTLPPSGLWDSLLEREDAAAMCGRLSAVMRDRRLTFGDRVICPFLRPFFLDAADEARVRGVAEMLWRLGERGAAGRVETPPVPADAGRRGSDRDAADADRPGAQRRRNPAGPGRSRLRDHEHRRPRRRLHPPRLA